MKCASVAELAATAADKADQYFAEQCRRLGPIPSAPALERRRPTRVRKALDRLAAQDRSGRS